MSKKKKEKISVKSDPNSCYQDIAIDLMASDRPAVNIGKEWEVTVSPKRSLSNIFGTHKKIEREIFLSISDLKIDNKLEVVTNDRMSMISIIVGGKEYSLPEGKSVPVMLAAENTSFSLFFNPNTIVDCSERQRRRNEHKSYQIKFWLNTCEEDGTIISQREIVINISFTHMVATPVVDSGHGARSMAFSTRLGLEKAGELVIRNENPLKHLPNIGLECEMIVKKGNQALTDGTIWLDYESASGAKVELYSNQPGKFSVTALPTNWENPEASEIRIPIRADIARIGNPCNESKEEFEYTFDFIVKYWNCNEKENVCQLPVPQTRFTIKGNRQEPNISKIEVCDPQTGIAQQMASGAPSIRLSRVYFLPGANMQLPIKMIVHNSANQGITGSGVVIRNFSYDVEFGPRTEEKYATRRDGRKTLVTLEGPQETALPNIADSKGEWNFVFHGDAVRDLYVNELEDRNYNVNIRIKVRFDYCLDGEGKAGVIDSYFDDNKQHFEGAIILPVYQQPNQTWLAIDFGTSAIVSKYGKSMINLRKQKSDLYPDSEDEYEQGTPFLSSNILLRPAVSEGQSQLMRDYPNATESVSYDKLAVCLSPTSTYEKANINTILPCLKLIVGYDMLPNIERYGNYIYNYIDEDGTLKQKAHLIDQVKYEDGETEDVTTPLAMVDTVFSEVYGELFTHFLSKAIQEGDEATGRGLERKINQIILTIPNTYTPAHMQRIRGIVKKALSGLNIRTIKFVSESDAVACYYQHNWTAINEPLGRADNEALKKNEVVLVYDMGAGTLDVTLFVKMANPDPVTKKEKVIINVRGKIGIAKAGNYLDALIAQLLAKRIKQLENFADPEKIDHTDRLKAALQLKTLIKNEIKPMLSAETKVYNFEANRSLGVKSDVRIDLDSDIKNAPEFKKYVSEVTSDFLKNFFSFFGGFDKLKINTVLMSGRSVKLKPIQEALKSALGKWAAPDMKVIDISSLTDKGSTFDRSKTVVVEGAMDYASLFGSSDSSVEFISRNIVANYGVLYRDIHGDVQYVELLNPRAERPVEIVKDEGMSIYTFDTPEKTIDLSGSESMILVQTYSANTRQDWVKGNQEYITPISEINVTSLPSRQNVRVKLSVDTRNVMKLYVNGMERNGITTSKIDINSRSNQFSLWPVLHQ